MKKAALLLLVLAPLLLAACGDSDDDTPSKTTPTETTGDAGGGAGAPSPEGTGGEAGGGSVVQIVAAEGTELAYTTDEATAKAGDVTIEFTNPQSLSHDVAVEDSGGETIGKTDIVADSKAIATIKGVKAGDYTFYCTVPGHQEAGMEGTLAVK